jgi:hypothetical protein
MADLWDGLMGVGQGFANGARSFGDQARWAMGAYGNSPQPALYAGGPDYPSKDDANAYVRNNYPTDGVHMFHVSRPETMYTPLGMKPSPGGREPTIGEFIDGAATRGQLMLYLQHLFENRK